MKCARVALAEMEMSPYGASCGTNVKHEMTEYLFLRILMQFGLFNGIMYRSGVRGLNLKREIENA